MKTVLRVLLLPLVLVALAGCGSQKTGSSSSPKTAPAAPTPAEGAPVAGEKIRIVDAAHTLLFALKPAAKGYRVEDTGGRRIAVIEVKDGGARVTDNTGQARYSVRRATNGFQLLAAPQQAGEPVELAQMAQTGSRFEIKDAARKTMLQGKTAAGVLRARAANGTQMVVTVGRNGLEVKDAKGRPLLRVAGARVPLAGAICAAGSFDTLQKAVLTAYLTKVQAQPKPEPSTVRGTPRGVLRQR
jgi:hypothetical protein